MKKTLIFVGIGCLVLLLAAGCIGVIAWFVVPEILENGGYNYYNNYYFNDEYYNNYTEDYDSYQEEENSQGSSGSTLPNTLDGAAAGAFEYTDCPFRASSQRVHCGYLTAPADHTNSSAGVIHLAVAIIQSQQDNPGNPPLVYLEGGPGGSALYGGEYLWINSPLGKDRDIILLDQRGTGYSQPSLNCIEYDQDRYANTSEAKILASCKQRLEDEGIDLSLFNSAQSAADVQLLRQALGYPQIDLLGISYGTRLALTVMRDHPEGIRSVILDSVYPPEADSVTEQPLITMQGLEVLVQDCQNSPACNQAYPDLFGMLTNVVTNLNYAPVTVTFYDYEYGEEYQEEIYGDDVVYAISDSMYDSKVIPYLPAFIGSLYAGQYDYAYEILDLPYANQTNSGPYYEEDIDLSDSEGMFYAVECYEEAVFGDLDAAENLVLEYDSAFTDGLLWDAEDILDTCNTWAAVQAGPIEDQPITSSIPTLVLNGEYDPVTPPSWAQTTASRLSNSQLFIFPGYGHAVIDAGPCPLELMVDFLASPTQPVNAACVSGVGPPDFVINP